MIIDALNTFFSAQSLAANATSEGIDLGEGGTGAGCLPLLIQVTQGATGAGTAKLTFRMPFGFVLTGIRASVNTFTKV